MRAKLALDPELVCPRGANCVSVYAVLSEVRALREAAAPLLPELVSFLESKSTSLHIPTLLVLKGMREKARPAVPKLVTLLGRDPNSGSDDVDSETFFVLEAIAAARPSPASVKRTLLGTVRRDSERFDNVAAPPRELRPWMLIGGRAGAPPTLGCTSSPTAMSFVAWDLLAWRCTRCLARTATRRASPLHRHLGTDLDDALLRQIEERRGADGVS